MYLGGGKLGVVLLVVSEVIVIGGVGIGGDIGDVGSGGCRWCWR